MTPVLTHAEAVARWREEREALLDGLAASLLDRPPEVARRMWIAWKEGAKGQPPRSPAWLADMRRRIDAERARRVQVHAERMQAARIALDAADVQARNGAAGDGA